MSGLVWVGIGGFVAIVAALAVCRVRRLHPAVKVWACRLAMVKIVVSTVFAFEAPMGAVPGVASGLLERYLLAVWLLGFTVVAFHAARSYVSAQRLKGMAVPTGAVLGLRAGRLNALPEPCVVGVLRPMLLLPTVGEAQPAVLRHELAHVRHGDAPFGLIAWLAYAVAWFVPGCGRLVAEHSLWQEAWADLSARQELGLSPGSQANALLAASSRAWPAVPGGLGYRGDVEAMARRIEAMFVKGYSWPMAAFLTIFVIVLAVPLRPSASASAARAPMRLYAPMAR